MDYRIHISKTDHLKKDQELRSLLTDIYSDSEFTNNLQNYYDRFYNLYILTCDNAGNKDADADDHVIDLYRHSYSSIFQALSDLKQHDSDSLEKIPDKIKTLLEYAFKEFKNSQQDEAKSRLRNALYKLYDHVHWMFCGLTRLSILTVILMKKTDQIKRQLKNMGDTFDSKADKLKTQAESLDTQIERVTENVTKIKIDVVAILGIFAAIIIGFVAPMVFASQLLANPKDTPAGKIMIASAVCGFVAISVFYMMYLILENIVFKNQKQPPLQEHLKNFRHWTLRDWILPVMIVAFVLIFFVGWCKLHENEGLPDPGTGYHDNSIVVNQNFK